MFSHLTDLLRQEIETVKQVLTANDWFRALPVIITVASPPYVTCPAARPGSMGSECLLANYMFAFPDTRDWRIYDHCAALTRLYSAYEQFVGSLVKEYLVLLPALYPAYADLPLALKKKHCAGVGHILKIMGSGKRYKRLLDKDIARDLAAGLIGCSPYTLLPEAFFAELNNLRFSVLCQLFLNLGCKHRTNS